MFLKNSNPIPAWWSDADYERVLDAVKSAGADGATLIDVYDSLALRGRISVARLREYLRVATDPDDDQLHRDGYISEGGTRFWAAVQMQITLEIIEQVMTELAELTLAANDRISNQKYASPAPVHPARLGGLTWQEIEQTGHKRRFPLPVVEQALRLLVRAGRAYVPGEQEVSGGYLARWDEVKAYQASRAEVSS